MEEIWKDILGYEGRYQVSNLGRVKRLNYRNTGKDRILKLQKRKPNSNYRSVNLVGFDGKTITYNVHILVGKTFIPNPNNYPNVLHYDEELPLEELHAEGNLWWGTSEDNTNDMVSKGRQCWGEKRYNSLLKAEDVHAIRDLRNETGWGYKRISKYLNLPINSVQTVINKGGWSNLK
jgi:hypothetical protein